MIFKVQKTGADTCGNTWTEGEPRYLEAATIEAVWKRLGRPRVTGYRIGKKHVASIRTPVGKGYGIWEENPAFDWERDKGKATEFESVGLHVQKVKVE